MSDKVKDIAARALKTLWQAALASVVVAIPEIVELIPSGWAALKPVLISVGVGAIAAGLSAAWNAVIKPALGKIKGGDANDESE